jgi:hypothetical protein
MRTATTPARATLFIAAALLALAAPRHANAISHPPSASAVSIADCGGDTCASVTLTFSEPVLVAGRRMHAPGTIIGKALEPLDKGAGEIPVLLSLQ